MNGLKYIFTNIGDVFVGELVDFNINNYTVLIPRSNLSKLKDLSYTNDLIDKLKEIGSVIPNNSIKKILDSSEVSQSKKLTSLGRTHQGNKQRKNMFIFGAGASAYCVFGEEKDNYKNDNLKAPLGNELFSKRFSSIYKNFKGVDRSIVNLRIPNLNVEEVLQNEWDEVEAYSNEEVMYNHINIQFYLQELLSQISTNILKYEENLFDKLAYMLQKKTCQSFESKFAFVSFNQDIILENSLSKYFVKRYQNIDDYINEDNYPYCIFKPHGSINWAWKPQNTEASHQTYQEILFQQGVNYHDLYFKILGNYQDMVDWNSYGLEMSISGKGRLNINKDKLELIQYHDTIHQFPAILIPYRDKDEFLMPNSHFAEMELYLEEAEALFIIGWKGNEKFFNKVLKDRANKLKKIVIADPNFNDVVDNLKLLLENKKIDIIHYKDFEDFVFNGLEKQLL